jgi:transposase
MTRRKRTKLRSISKSQRREIIEEYLSGEETKAEVWRRHTGEEKEKGRLLRWMRQLGYLRKADNENVIPLIPMPSQKPKRTKEEMERRIKELEDQLLDSQLKEEAYRRMIDIAEKDLKVSIRKKPNTK